MIYHAQDDCLCDLREEGGDCKECHKMPHHIIITGAAGRAFTHINIPYTSLRSPPIQNFNSTRVKAN